MATAKNKKEDKKASGKPEWMLTGAAGAERKRQDDRAYAERKEKEVPDFWMVVGEKKKIIFVDDDGHYCYRHMIKRGQRFYHVTCMKDFGGCKVCDDPDVDSYPGFRGHYTVIDLTEFTTKKGEKVRFSKRLFAAKGSTMIQRIADLKKKHGSLIGRVFEVSRYTAQDPSSGGTMDLATNDKGKPYPVVDIAKQFGADAAVPFDYEKILAPSSDSELASLGVRIGEGNDAVPAVPAEEENAELKKLFG